MKKPVPHQAHFCQAVHCRSFATVQVTTITGRKSYRCPTHAKIQGPKKK